MSSGTSTTDSLDETKFESGLRVTRSAQKKRLDTSSVSSSIAPSDLSSRSSASKRSISVRQPRTSKQMRLGFFDAADFNSINIGRVCYSVSYYCATTFTIGKGVEGASFYNPKWSIGIILFQNSKALLWRAFYSSERNIGGMCFSCEQRIVTVFSVLQLQFYLNNCAIASQIIN